MLQMASKSTFLTTKMLKRIITKSDYKRIRFKKADFQISFCTFAAFFEIYAILFSGKQKNQ